MCGGLQRIGIVDSIDDVEKLGSELDVYTFAEARDAIVLDERHVHVFQSRPINGVAAGVAQVRVVRSRLPRVGIAGSIDVVNLVLLADRFTAGPVVEVGEAEGIRTAQTQRIAADERTDGQAGASLKNTTVLPAVDYPAGRSKGLRGIRQEEEVVEDKVLAYVEVGDSNPAVRSKIGQATDLFKGSAYCKYAWDALRGFICRGCH